ncbi:MAG: hypothetical protein M0R28_20930 [Pigmentiphaga sp.]|nr:hypothetical protein [Pigmentiphaga sp.]
MADSAPAGNGAEATPGTAPQQDDSKDPFEGFESEAFNAGEPIEDKPAKPAKPAAPAPAAAAPKPAGGTEGDGENPDDDDAGTGGDEGAERTPGSLKKSVQERINEITRARREAERRAEAAERELNELRNAKPPAAAEKPAKPAAGKGGDESTGAEGDAAKGPPDPEKYEFGELDSRYIRDLARFEAKAAHDELRELDRQEREQAQAVQQQQAAATKFQQRVEEGSKKYEDFYEKVVIGAEKVEWPLSPELGSLIVESDVGADIAYHLATNPDEAAQVFALSPLEQARYFGRIEAKFSAEQSAAPGEDAKDETAPAKTPKAPPPVAPARGSGGRSKISANTDDFASFEAVANQGG